MRNEGNTYSTKHVIQSKCRWSNCWTVRRWCSRDIPRWESIPCRQWIASPSLTLDQKKKLIHCNFLDKANDHLLTFLLVDKARKCSHETRLPLLRRTAIRDGRLSHIPSTKLVISRWSKRGYDDRKPTRGWFFKVILLARISKCRILRPKVKRSPIDIRISASYISTISRPISKPMLIIVFFFFLASTAYTRILKMRYRVLVV